VLRELEVKYVLVGGMALELSGYPTGTDDVDFAATTKEYDRVLRVLAEDDRFQNVESLGTIGGAQFFVGDRWIDVEFVNPKLFRGKRSGDWFINYMLRYRSDATPFGPIARPEVTWYMRLAVPDWQIYVQKIVRDVRAGVPAERLEDAIRMAKVFGVEEVVRRRAEKAREFLSKIS
jgi:hypothetical protein